MTQGQLAGGVTIHIDRVEVKMFNELRVLRRGHRVVPTTTILAANRASNFI